MRNFFHSERGAAAAEYALVLAMIGTSLAIGVSSLSSAIGGALGRGSDAVAAAADSGAGGNNGDNGNHGDGNNGDNGNHGDGNNGKGNGKK